MIWTIIIALVILWALGFSFKIGGKLVHAFLVIALIVVVIKLLS